MNTSDDILLEKYFRGHLSEQELLVFNERKKDPTFVEQLNIEQQLFNSLNDSSWSFTENVDAKIVTEYQELFESEEINDLKATLKTLNNKQHDSKVRSLNWKPIVLTVAAAVVLIITIFSFNNQPVDSSEIYASYYKVDDLTYSIVRSADLENSLQEAQQLFFEEQYEEALLLIDKHISQKGLDSPELYLMKGISLTELGSYQQAQLTYDSLINSDFLDAQKGYWYKGLMYLKKGDTEQALTLFKKIESENYYNSSQASEIIKMLE